MKKHLPIVLILVCAAAFVFGVVQLFKLRFEVGDVYPAYSSLRSDPLGAMAFYESLAQLPGISVRRDHSSADKLPEGKDTTYLHLAARTGEWDWLPEELWKEINAFTLNGGRLAITFTRREPSRFDLSPGRRNRATHPSKSKAARKRKDGPRKSARSSAIR